MLTATQRARIVRAWREGLPASWRLMLSPATLAYRGGLALRRAAYASGMLRTRSLPCPVVAVGNLTVGGTGKTPLVELIARTLTAQGKRVVILSRGYGRRRNQPIDVVSDGVRLLLTAQEAGDEPLLLARRLRGVPVVVGHDRFRAGTEAVARFSPDTLLLDDGFQQMRLHKDVEVVCLDALAPWGRGGLLPQGTLREPPYALARADLLVLTHATSCPDLSRVQVELRTWAPAAPVALGAYEAEGVEDVRSGALQPLAVLGHRPVLAFAGIAVPESFRATLSELGVAPRAFLAFPDHHPYDRADVLTLEGRARAAGAEVLLTTEKDAVRLPLAGTMPLWALHVRLGFHGEDGTWWAALEAGLAVH